MQALEKAAKDREGSEPGASKGGISLEPMPAPTAAAREPAAAAPREPALAAPQPARNNATAEPKQPAQAATVMKAGRSGGSSSGILRARPLFVFSLLAGLGAAGYGGYVYLQLTNPGLFVKQAPRPPQNTQVAAPPPVAPAAAVQAPPPLASLGAPEIETPPATAQPAGMPGKGAAPAIAATALSTAGATAASGTTQTTAAVAPETKNWRGPVNPPPAPQRPLIAATPLAPPPAPQTSDTPNGRLGRPHPLGDMVVGGGWGGWGSGGVEVGGSVRKRKVAPRGGEGAAGH